jgi:hypothetical protein
MGCVRQRLRRKGIAMPISISSFSIMSLLLVVLCSLPTSIRSRASKQDATLAFWIWVHQEPLVYWGKQIGEEFIWIARFQQDRVLEFLVVKNAKNPENEKNGRKDKDAFRFCSAPLIGGATVHVVVVQGRPTP